MVPLSRELAACPQVLTASLPGRQKLHWGSGPPSTVDRRWPASYRPFGLRCTLSNTRMRQMKSGVPWQCAGVGRPGGREPSNPSREDNCRHRADVPNPAAVDTLRGDLAEIRLLLDDAAPRSDIEALQGEINELAERADESRGTGNAAAAVASIERRLTEIRDALCVLRPAESLLGMARVVQQ